MTEIKSGDGVMNCEGLEHMFPWYSFVDKGKQVFCHNGIIRLRLPEADLQQNSEETERRENVTASICHCHLNLTPFPLHFLPEPERKQVYWQPGLGATDNNAGFVPQLELDWAFQPPPPTQQLNKPSVQRFRHTAI